MPKQPDVYENREPSGSPPTSRHKEDGDDSKSGSFYDQADMQRLGKEQELKVRCSCFQHSNVLHRCGQKRRDGTHSGYVGQDLY